MSERIPISQILFEKSASVRASEWRCYAGSGIERGLQLRALGLCRQDPITSLFPTVDFLLVQPSELNTPHALCFAIVGLLGIR